MEEETDKPEEKEEPKDKSYEDTMDMVSKYVEKFKSY